MAVESRFVVIRHGVEVQTFMDKKAADDYDKMLDMADNLTAMLSETPFDMTDELKENLSIYLAQNREDVLVALQAKKAKATEKPIKQAAAKVEVKIETKESEIEPEVKVTTKTATKKTSATKASTKKPAVTKADNDTNETESEG